MQRHGALLSQISSPGQRTRPHTIVSQKVAYTKIEMVPNRRKYHSQCKVFCNTCVFESSPLQYMGKPSRWPAACSRGEPTSL